MKLHILTLFPGIIEGYFSSSIAARAVKEKILDVNIVNIRDFAEDKHRTCDDYPYGGGPGMILKPEPLAGALDSVQGMKKRVIYPTPSGRLFNQKEASGLSVEEEIVFICGRYEGVDQRIIDLYVDDELSIGDYVISSGEIAVLVIIDAIYRLITGVINSESLKEESFSLGLLEYPQYTRPHCFKDISVPEVLVSGHHENIQKWRIGKSLEKTKKNRPELLSDLSNIMKEDGGIEDGPY